MPQSERVGDFDTSVRTGWGLRYLSPNGLRTSMPQSERVEDFDTSVRTGWGLRCLSPNGLGASIPQSERVEDFDTSVRTEDFDTHSEQELGLEFASESNSRSD